MPLEDLSEPPAGRARLHPSVRRLKRISSALAWLLLAASTLAAQNPIQIENSKTGSPDWQLTNPATNHEIEGYASLTSVNRGGQISFFVNTADATYTLDVFRMGWYGGAGARRVMAPVQVTGVRQTIPSPDPATGMVECQWVNPYQLSIPLNTSDPTDWASGVYLARLTGNTSSKQSFIIFIVRDDPRASTYINQITMNTFQAYNNWGGKSLYTWNSTNSVAATQVSYNRPFAFGNQGGSASGVGAGEFLTNVQPSSVSTPAGWGYNMVRFLEREGIDVTYISDVDAHENGNLLLTHKAVIIAGHSEYWSWQMRMNIQAARDAGKGIGVFAANDCYWQIRFAPSPVTGAADRTIICYKSTADPYASDPNLSYLTTVRWRDPPVNLPEETLLGIMFNPGTSGGDLIVADAPHWVYTYTGVQNGAHLTGLWGYEVDGTHGLQPAGTADLTHETLADGTPGDSVAYTAASGAIVINMGTFQWSWGLDDYNVPNIRPSVISPIAQQITRNALNGLAALPLAPAFSVIPSPPVQTVSTAGVAPLSYTISVTSFGYSPTVSLSATGLPPNTTATFSPATISGSGSSTLTLSFSSAPPLGTYVVTINATDGSQTRTGAVTVISTNDVPKTNWKLVFVDSQETQCASNPATNGFDGNPTTIWHTQYCPTVAPLPHEIQIDLGATYQINQFSYLPRQDGGVNGRIGQYEFYATSNLSSWGSPISTGTFANDANLKLISFPQNTYRYIRLRALTEANGAQYTSMAEIDVYGGVSSSPDFSFSAAPSSQTVAAGNATTFTVSVAAQNGFSGTVSLGVSGLPTGATAVFSPASLNGSGSSTLTVTTAANTPAGTSSLTITGTTGSLSHSATVTLAVTAGTSGTGVLSVDFVGTGTAMGTSETAGVIAKANWNNATGSKSSSPLSLVDETGTTTAATVSWSADGVWSTPITDSPGNARMMKGYLDDPAGNPTTATVAGLSAGTYSIYVYTDGDNANTTRTGNYQISGPGVTTATIGAIDAAGANFNGTFSQAVNSNGNYVLFSGVSISSGFTITATPGATTGNPRAPLNGIQIVPSTGGSPDFSIGASPSSQTVTAGGTTTYTVTVGALNGFTSTVNLSASGLPTGATASFNPASVTGSGTSTLTITTTGSTPPGSSTLTITGTSGSLTHTSAVTLVVSATADFSVSVAPSSQTIAPGGSTTYTVSVTALNGFNAAVTLGASGLPAGATASFSPASVTGSGTSTLTIGTTGSTPPGSSTLTVTGTSGSLTHSATATLVITSSSGPAAISIDFVGTDTAMASTETAGVIAKPNWNSATGAASGSPLSLVDETGTATAATVTWNSDNGWSTPITDTAGNNRMMRGYLDNGKGNPTTVTVSGLAAGAYDIYVYLDGDNAGFTRTGVYQISGPGIVTASISATDAANTNFSG
ncbi:MAG TPA: N,N-dimethylformamidase beta subunit family domain-containing protein, partial [Bryobacteraceae bacterium]|nr:N,N-dimethylformamidase beta subunit family domain-containing protein [Bryobacteraceae bacterium]